jgi:hypothetical protein
VQQLWDRRRRWRKTPKCDGHHINWQRADLASNS